MAAETWYMTPDTTALVSTNTGAEATTATGWTVAKVAPTVYALMDASTERASTSFGATAVPAGVTPTTVTPSACLLQFNETGANHADGTFATGTWTATFKVIAVSSGGDQNGLVRAALWKCSGNPISAGSFTLLAGPTEGTAVTALTTTVAQTSTVTFSGVSAVTLTSENFFIEVGWKITGAGGANTRDVLLRKGTGITVVTPSFTASGGSTVTPPPPHVISQRAVHRSYNW